MQQRPIGRTGFTVSRGGPPGAAPPYTAVPARGRSGLGRVRGRGPDRRDRVGRERVRPGQRPGHGSERGSTLASAPGLQVPSCPSSQWTT